MWNYNNTYEFVVPKGTYYVGDLCYALEDDIYHDVFGQKGYASGLYQHEEDFFLVSGTAFGDGEYVDTLGRTYAVDAGILGICPIALAKKGTDGGQVIEFDGDTECYFRGGMFSFTPVGEAIALFIIDTYGDDSEFSE